VGLIVAGRVTRFSRAVSDLGATLSALTAKAVVAVEAHALVVVRARTTVDGVARIRVRIRVRISGGVDIVATAASGIIATGDQGEPEKENQRKFLHEYSLFRS